MRCRYEPHGQAHHLRDRPRAGPLREGQREVREAASSRAGAVCGDRDLLQILAMDLDGKPLSAAEFQARFGAQPIILETSQQ